MNRKKLSNWTSGTIKLILNRHPNGFVSFNVQGERGLGKSMYAYKVCARIYQMLFDLDEFDAYKMALEHFIFSPKELITLVKNNIDNDYVTPIIVLDDATVYFNAYKFFTDLYEVILLKGILDTIRTAITGLLITCPNRKQLLRFMRDYNDYKIQIIKSDGTPWSRLARCYKFNMYPDEKKYNIQVPYQDKYSVYVPGDPYDIDTPYGAYMAKRKYYLKEINDKMINLLKEKGIMDNIS